MRIFIGFLFLLSILGCDGDRSISPASQTQRKLEVLESMNLQISEIQPGMTLVYWRRYVDGKKECRTVEVIENRTSELVLNETVASTDADDCNATTTVSSRQLVYSTEQKLIVRESNSNGDLVDVNRGSVYVLDQQTSVDRLGASTEATVAGLRIKKVQIFAPYPSQSYVDYMVEAGPLTGFVYSESRKESPIDDPTNYWQILVDYKL